MTQYEIQIARNAKYADRTKVLVQTPKLLVFAVDDKIIYTHEYNEAGQCVAASWNVLT